MKDKNNEGTHRVFDSGASRDSDEGKLDYEGFVCPYVIKKFAEYMHSKRSMSNGEVRDSDNWQKGIPKSELIKSAVRHMQDWKLTHRGYEDEAIENIEETLCALMFNTMGYLKAIIDEKRR